MTAVSGLTSASPQTQVTPLVTDPSVSSSGSMFQNILDTINPLQHIPFVSGLYRAATGSTISTGSKLAGDTIYGLAMGGGLLGLATSVGSSVADVAVAQATGSDISSHIVNTVTDPAITDNATALVSDTTLNPVSSAPQVTPGPVFFPMEKHQVLTSAQFHHAQLMDTVNKDLLQAAS